MTTMKMPTYLSKFKCIADKCEDTCCNGFDVPIDKNTYLKYENVKDRSLRESLMNNVKKNEKSTSDVDFGYINATCSCPFLTQTGTCGVQEALGELALSSTCSKYPKHISIIDKKAEKWATLSCPEIARLALLDKNGMKFEEIEEPVDVERDMANFQLQTNTLPMTHYFYDLREFTIEILQDRTFNLDVRISILDAFYKEMNNVVEKGEEDKIPTLIADFRRYKTFSISEEEFNLGLFLDTLLKLQEQSTFVSRYEQTVNEMVQGFHKEVNPIGLEFIDQHAYILENYLVHYVFQKLFPFSYGENVYESFKMLELHYNLLQIHILGVGSYLEEMNEPTVIRIIQSFVKEAEHNSVYLPIFFKKLKLGMK